MVTCPPRSRPSAGRWVHGCLVASMPLVSPRGPSRDDRPQKKLRDGPERLPHARVDQEAVRSNPHGVSSPSRPAREPPAGATRSRGASGQTDQRRGETGEGCDLLPPATLRPIQLQQPTGTLEQLGLVVAADVNGPMHAPASLTDDEPHLPDPAA